MPQPLNMYFNLLLIKIKNICVVTNKHSNLNKIKIGFFSSLITKQLNKEKMFFQLYKARTLQCREENFYDFLEKNWIF